MATEDDVPAAASRVILPTLETPTLTKAELADQLVERDLPKSGVVEELVGRLVEADEAAAGDDK